MVNNNFNITFLIYNNNSNNNSTFLICYVVAFIYFYIRLKP